MARLFRCINRVSGRRLHLIFNFYNPRYLAFNWFFNVSIKMILFLYLSCISSIASTKATTHWYITHEIKFMCTCWYDRSRGFNVEWRSEGRSYFSNYTVVL
jgi:hypothetical protein